MSKDTELTPEQGYILHKAMKRAGWGRRNPKGEEKLKLEIEYRDYLKSIITSGKLGYWMRERSVDLLGDVDEMWSDYEKYHKENGTKPESTEVNCYSIAIRDMLVILLEWGRNGGILTFKDFIHEKAK